jgi:hypothetical protein
MGLEDVFQDLSSTLAPILKELSAHQQFARGQTETLSAARNAMAIVSLAAASWWFAVPLFRFSLVLADLILTLVLYVLSAPALLLAALTGSRGETRGPRYAKTGRYSHGFEDTFEYQKEASARAAERQRVKESVEAFQVLGVPEDAEDEEIRKAYRKLMKMYHPDFFMTAKPAEQQRARKMTLKIRAAYDTLTDSDSEQHVH